MGELKTLNETKLNFQDRTELNEKYELWLKKKFLKEDYMNLIKFFQIEIRKKDKQEAIKWIKEIEKGIDKDVSFLFGIKISSEKLNKNESEILIKWIKYFFGITEEDLN